MGSWKCGANVYYNFCSAQKANLCNMDDYSSGAGRFNNPDAARVDKKIPVVIICEYDERDEGAITIFDNPGCTGHSTRLKWDKSSESEYSAFDLHMSNHDVDTASSVVVPVGYTAIFYAHDAFDSVADGKLEWHDTHIG